MKIATILFTYNRSMHTKTVLRAMQENELMTEKLYIFQDGIKNDTDRAEWGRVSDVIKSVSFCDTEVFIAQKNKGLANSIIDGVSFVLQKYDAVIVLEDDCVPHPKFISFMMQSLTKYENEQKVYSIGGCAWPVDLKNTENDAYFCQRISSYGWGTWKNRWDQYERDYMLLKKILQNPEAKQRLDIWGPDLAEQLKGNITGDCDSWAVFWALKVIEKNGYCLSPYESLITNIGFDGTGVHCGTLYIDRKYRAKSNMSDFVLPEHIKCSEECKNTFCGMLYRTPVRDMFRSYQDLLISLLNNLRSSGCIQKMFESFYGKTISVWGTGKICDYLLEELKDRCTVACIIMSTPASEQYHEIPVVSVQNMPDSVEEIIVIPFYELDKLRNKVINAGKKVKLTGFDEMLKRKIERF